MDDLARGAGQRFFKFAEAQAECTRTEDSAGDMAVLLDWITSYLMASHPDLGRSGAVCPFTRQAARLDTVRIAVWNRGVEAEDKAFALVRGAFSELNSIPCKKGMEHFRTVIIGFPQCGEEEGIAMLRRLQRAHRFYSLGRGRMIGLMYQGSQDQGLWNKDFRPLRSPMPILAVRHMVEQDAPFAALHPALLMAYLARFPLKGSRRLFTQWRGG